MPQMIVSTKYQVVIPKQAREELDIHAGQKVMCIIKGGIIHLIPDRPLSSLRGLLKGVDAQGIREKKDRL